ncbi:MAG: hypothetical protein V1899_09100 [Planctomycetota bacterium]
MIAHTLAEATSALDFETPLESDDPRWTDLSKARNNSNIERIKRLFERQTDNHWIHVVFASHRGAGKSTELKRLSANLAQKYFPVYFEATSEMDTNRFEMEDLLLVIAHLIEKRMRELGTPLDTDLLQSIENWFSEVVLSDEQGKSYLAVVKAEAKAGASVPFFVKLMASLTSSCRIESSHRESIKQTLRKFPGTLMEYVNKLLFAADQNLSKGGRKLLLIIDNMDRYEPNVIDKLLVQSADRFKKLACHLIVTPPISLVLRPESQALEAIFHCETMPTVSLRKKNQPYHEVYDPGLECLLEVLRKRIDLDKLIPEKAVQNRLVAASGGAIRELIEFAQDATLDATGEIITATDLELTLNRRRHRLRDRIDANGWWETLMSIAETKHLSKDDAFLEVLYQRIAFQYNGEVWYDVHPLITELPTFVTKQKVVPQKK